MPIDTLPLLDLCLGRHARTCRPVTKGPLGDREQPESGPSGCSREGVHRRPRELTMTAREPKRKGWRSVQIKVVWGEPPSEEARQAFLKGLAQLMAADLLRRLVEGDESLVVERTGDQLRVVSGESTSANPKDRRKKSAKRTERGGDSGGSGRSRPDARGGRRGS